MILQMAGDCKIYAEEGGAWLIFLKFRKIKQPQ
ncbi:hypothetical protein SA2149_00780 [Aggregatibacter actinomycetemcomitans serotype e str. SA2149]|nr:hypothetical protein SA2149_00780 [Aggregatibacter actinomycetemcomitans serotype e str. SA2149]KYK79538.1 hypothetical protein SC383S_06070 [Aggregatibacter actinomycetemcomitans SC383s]